MIEGRIGEMRITRVHETVLFEDARSWFPDFDAAALEAHLSWLAPQHYDPRTGRIAMPVHSWLLRDGRRTILIDTCCGAHKDRLGIPGMHRLDAPYLQRLAAAGVAPEAVDFVLCTHLHLDHVGWNTRLADGRWVPTFPNARYVFSRAELDRLAAPDAGALDRLVFQDSVAPLLEAGQAIATDGAHSLEDVLLIRPAPGHSSGHVRIELEGGGDLGIFAGDIIHSPIQAPLWRWSTRFCDDPAQAARTRGELLAFCAERGALLMPGHFGGPGVARVQAAGDGFGLRFGWERPATGRGV